jgi:hypothetical protein
MTIGAWITLRLRTAPETTDGGDTVYVVNAHVTAAYGLPEEVFVHRTVDDGYVCPALRQDLTLPASRAAAMAEEKDFYRARSARIVYLSRGAAIQGLATLKLRVEQLRLQMEADNAQELQNDEIVTFGAL